MPPHKWDKTNIKKESDGIQYIVENVWIREVRGRDGKVTFHYYDEGYDVNKALCWQYFEAKTEQSVAQESDAPQVLVEERPFTPEELAALDRRRRQLLYAIASDDNLFLKVYHDEKYSQELRTQLYHMNIAIGTGEVAMVTAGIGFSFMAMAAAPAVGEFLFTKGIITDILIEEGIDRMSSAIGLPLAEILSFKDVKNLVKDGLDYLAEKGTKALPKLKGGKRPTDLDNTDKTVTDYTGKKDEKVLPEPNKTDAPELKGGKRPSELDNTDKTVTDVDEVKKRSEKRSQLYSADWANASLSTAIKKFAPDAVSFVTPKGKIIYRNDKTGIQVVYDKHSNYFRIEDTNLTGKRLHLDMNGEIPNNKIENGRIKGRNKAEYEQLTHFNNTD